MTCYLAGAELLESYCDDRGASQGFYQREFSVDRVRAAMVDEVLAALETNRIVILEGPVGSGLSSVLSAVSESSAQGAVRRLFPEASEREKRYSSISHLIGNASSAHIDLLSLVIDNGSLLVIVDDAQHLDDGSMLLLLWCLKQADLKLLISCADLDAIALLAETQFEATTTCIRLPPLNSEQIASLLEDTWQRPAKAWEVVSTARFAGSNLGAVKTFAEFALENFPEAMTPESWMDSLLEPEQLSHTLLHDYVRALKDNHASQNFNALQILAVVGPCTVRQAVQLFDASLLVELSVLGLIGEPNRNALVQLSHGLLDLSMRLCMETERVHEIYDAYVRDAQGQTGFAPTPMHLAWWQDSGIQIPADQLWAGARQCLFNGQPSAALRLLKNDDSAVAAWLIAEAYILSGDAVAARSWTETALQHPQSPEQLGATEALVCVGAGFWPQHAARFAQVGGLEVAATAVYLSTQGAHAQGIDLAAQLSLNTDEQMWQNVQALASLAEALEGKSQQAQLRMETLGDLGPDASAITLQNVTEARRMVQLLSGDWNTLRESTLGGYALHAVVDRSGSTADICFLLAEPSGANQCPIDYEVHAPVGYVLMRELSRTVGCAHTDPDSALEQLSSYLISQGDTLPIGLKLFALGWEVKLHLETGSAVPPNRLTELTRLASNCEGVMAHVLGQLAAGLAHGSDAKLEAARSLARRHGMGEWLPTLPKSAVRAVSQLLSTREGEIARQAAAGARSTEIAICLDLSVRTVEKHLGNIYRKLELSGREELSRVLG